MTLQASYDFHKKLVADEEDVKMFTLTPVTKIYLQVILQNIQ